MHQRPPFRLTQTHWLQAFVQFQPPSAGRPVQQRAKKIDIGGLHGSKFVSLLTNSKSEAVSMPTPHSILSNKIDSFR
jgi:hypothetical protein